MVTLKIPPQKAILLLKEKVEEAEKMMLSGEGLSYYDYVGWCSKVWSVIDGIYGPGDIHPEEIRMTWLPACSCSESAGTQRMVLEVYHSRLLDYIDEVERSVQGSE